VGRTKQDGLRILREKIKNRRFTMPENGLDIQYTDALIPRSEKKGRGGGGVGGVGGGVGGGGGGVCGGVVVGGWGGGVGGGGGGLGGGGGWGVGGVGVSRKGLSLLLIFIIVGKKKLRRDCKRSVSHLKRWENWGTIKEEVREKNSGPYRDPLIFLTKKKKHSV